MSRLAAYSAGNERGFRFLPNFVLPVDSYSYSFIFGNNNQYTAGVEVNDGRILMLPLPQRISPKLIHAHTGWIENSYQSIVCLPNKIMIVIRNDFKQSDNMDLDGVTY